MTTPRYDVKKIGDQYVPVRQDHHPRMNRVAMIGWGGLLLWLGLESRGKLRLALSLGGVWLLIRGASDGDAVVPPQPNASRARQGNPKNTPSYPHQQESRASQTPTDLVDEQGMESFPASDPPSRTNVSHS